MAAKVDTTRCGMDTQQSPEHAPERLLNDPEACAYLRIGNRQLLAWRNRGWIPFIRIGRALRYRRSELDAALEALAPRRRTAATDGRTASPPDREGPR